MTDSNPNIVQVNVQTDYLPTESLPEKQRYVFSYTITLHNHSPRNVKLLSRHWIITDSDGKTQEVKGEGVVGQQPLLAPGDRYQYTSGAILPTSIGTMKGSYQMIDEAGEIFQTAIPEFVLSTPHTLH